MVTGDLIPSSKVDAEAGNMSENTNEACAVRVKHEVCAEAKCLKNLRLHLCVCFPLLRSCLAGIAV